MAQRTDIFDLGRLGCTSGEGRRARRPRSALDPLEFGGQRYESDDALVPVRLDVSRTAAGFVLRLRYAVALNGPCMRCLEPARLTVSVDAAEVDQPDEAADDELTSPYVESDQLDLHPGPATPSCSRCPRRSSAARTAWACARSAARTSTRRVPATRTRAEPDPRWAALREIRFE